MLYTVCEQEVCGLKGCSVAVGCDIHPVFKLDLWLSAILSCLLAHS